MIHFLFMLIMPLSAKEQASKDSLLIYNTYKGSIEMMKATKDYNRWYKISDSLDRVTAQAFERLSAFNNAEYQPVESYNKEGFGETYRFPEPTGYKEPNQEQTGTRASSFTIMDRQTKFFTRGDGKTRIPYIERLHFDEHHQLLKVDKVIPSLFFTEGQIVCYDEAEFK
jgi:hypothetical protein